MNERFRPEDHFEERLKATARRFSYPPSPDLPRVVASRMMRTPRPARPARRKVLLAGAILALILAVILAVPPVRAAVLDWIRVGAVRIFLAQPVPTATPTIAPGTPTPAASTPTVLPTSTPLASVLDISGPQATLAAAQTLAGFPILLPGVPSDLGRPDHVFEQNLGSPMVVLVWMDKAHPATVRLTLAETSAENVVFQKIQPPTVTDTSVNGRPAVWVDAPYMLISGTGDTVVRRLVENGHTLVWTQGKMTYRLETALDLPAAIRIAASLR